MKNALLNTPVALIVFNRPEHASKVFEQIAKVRPSKFFLISDGPRLDRNESDLIELSRAIIKLIDWKCEVFTNFSDSNLGCKYRPASGINWVFQHVEEAIILEDDCLPDLSFFAFCEELLEYYRCDPRVAMIAGSNLAPGCFSGNDSYFFSKHTFCWGWATWRDRWENSFDIDLKKWPLIRETSFFEVVHGSKSAAKAWTTGFDLLYENKIDAWDYQWLFANWLEGKVTVVPKGNLVSNIGFSDNATHTFSSSSPLANLRVVPMRFPLRHPGYVYVNSRADKLLYNKVFGVKVQDRIKKIWLDTKTFIKRMPGGERLASMLRKDKRKFDSH